MWIAGLEADEEDALARIGIEEQMDQLTASTDIDRVSEVVNRGFKHTTAEQAWLGVLKHMILLPTNSFQR